MADSITCVHYIIILHMNWIYLLYLLYPNDCLFVFKRKLELNNDVQLLLCYITSHFLSYMDTSTVLTSWEGFLAIPILNFMKYVKSCVQKTIHQQTSWPSKLTSCTAPQRKRVGSRAMLIQLSLRFLLTNVNIPEQAVALGRRTVFQGDRTHDCSEMKREVDSMFMSLTLAAQTQSKLMDSVYLITTLSSPC